MPLSAPRQPRVFSGIGITRAIALGQIYPLGALSVSAAVETIAAQGVAEETARLDAAVDAEINEIDAVRARQDRDADNALDILALLDAQRAMLADSRLVRGARARIEQQSLSAECAVTQETAALVAQFRALPDRYIAARADDIAAIGQRLVARLMGRSVLTLADIPAGGIVLARDLTPAEIAALDPRRIGGVLAVQGGVAGHTAVVARGAGLPAVLGLGEDILAYAVAGARVIVDGLEGKVILDPNDAAWADYQQRRADVLREDALLSALVNEAAMTRDGHTLSLCANLEHPRDVGAIVATGADGIGLLRSEFLFMNRADLPGEDEQYAALSELVDAMSGRMVTFRTLDIGGDKMAAALDRHLGDAANPALGLRGVRLSLHYPDLLAVQFRAMLRAAAHGPTRIMLPMVTTADEVIRARRMLEAAWDDLAARGARLPADMPQLGVMIEIPAAALSADSLATVSDFFALGTNDLVQYTVAIDRTNDQVADLYNPLNPAVLRLMHFTLTAGEQAGIEVSICGEMAADTRLTALLIGMGVRAFSVGAASLPRIKDRIRRLSLADSQRLAEDVLMQHDPDVIQRLIIGEGA